MTEYICADLSERPGCKVSPFWERRERVVRCRDCAHAHPCPLANSEKLMCALHDEMFVNSDDFCAWGEPRDGSER